MDKNAIFLTLKDILVTEFEIDADLVSLEKLLEENLDLDSLDAIDLINYLTDHLNGDPDPTLFKDARTVEDLVNLLAPIWKQR